MFFEVFSLLHGLIQDHYLSLSLPLECLLRTCQASGWQPKGWLKAGAHSVSECFLFQWCLSGGTVSVPVRICIFRMRSDL